MPITCDIPLRKLTQDEFGEVAFEVIHHAFAIHNEMGRFLTSRFTRKNCCGDWASVLSRK